MKLMKLVTALLFLLPLSPAFASWHFNEDAGFGIYQPEGWNLRVNGRSSRLLGPAKDSSQSEIFLGSDWVSHISTQEDLAAYLRREFGVKKLVPTAVSELKGYRIGDTDLGAIYLLRTTNNVIVIQYALRGSLEQIEEGHTILSSIEIRTKGIEN